MSYEMQLSHEVYLKHLLTTFAFELKKKVTGSI